MICEKCFGMLRGQVGRQLMGSFDLRFDHHKSEGSLKQAADTGCCICWRVWEDMVRSESRIIGRSSRRPMKAAFLGAYLTELRRPRSDLYLLYFRMTEGPKLSTFVLERTPDCIKSPQYRYTPTATRLDSPEVLELAKFWLHTCLEKHDECARVSDNPATAMGHSRTDSKQDRIADGSYRFYPTRLLELTPTGAIKKLQTVGTDFTKRRPLMRYASTVRQMEEVEPESVRLIVTKSAQHMTGEELDTPRGEYVTLSHCWGKGSKLFSLNQKNLDTFRTRGILVRELPRTFRQAISFARRLAPDVVKYIWIDSLCIIQDSKDHKDWEYEAAQMYQVYRNSYINISATAARTGADGIYTEREPRSLWESEINLNAELVSSYSNDDSNADANGSAKLDFQDEPVVAGLSMRTKRRKGILGSKVQRCAVIDPAFWHLKVDDAPINQRAWVLQERLLAPRVIHFCDDQVAWECGQLDAAESAPHGISDLEIRKGLIRTRIRLKDQIMHTDGDADAGLEQWLRIVERYSRTSLTQAKDKLIALAGIAELMSKRIGGDYVAGLWMHRLEGQLLWRVETVYKNNKFLYPSRRPLEDRAPSFSWAAIDAPQGIRCGELKFQDKLLIKVEKISVEPSGASIFGQVKQGAYLMLSCQLLNIRIQKRKRPVEDDSMYSWAVDEYVPGGKTRVRASVYLDSALDDFDQGQEDAQLIPAYKNARGYVICLLLRRDMKASYPRPYRRVGISVIPPFMVKDTSKLMDAEGRLKDRESETIMLI